MTRMIERTYAPADFERVVTDLRSARIKIAKLQRRPRFPDGGMAVTSHQLHVIAGALKSLGEMSALLGDGMTVKVANLGAYRDIMQVLADAP